MGAAYFLRGQYDITFYEKNNYAGGHTNTLTVDEGGHPVYIDSAFMVYNETTYPLLTRLFKELDIHTKPTSMSFSVQHVPSGLEFSGTGYNGLFAQRRNLFNAPYIKMLLEISRFGKEAGEVLKDDRYLTYSLGEYAREKKYSEAFLQRFLIPMSSAVWSTPIDAMLEFPIVSLVRFFKNHCFLGLEGHLNWRTCVGGSRQYRDKLLKAVNAKLNINTPAVKVIREEGGVMVVDSTGHQAVYDNVLIAVHADEVLDILDRPTELESRLLKCFPYHPNKTTLHTDDIVMPKTRRAWSSWNYRISINALRETKATTIYDMNSLQGVSTKKNYFISINDPGLIDAKKIIWETQYRHPMYSVQGQHAQKELPHLNANGPVYFAGAYFRFGFHEDGLLSGLHAARAISGTEIWP